MVKIVVKIWKFWQVTRGCGRLGQEHTSMKGKVSVEILQLGCGFLEHNFAKVGCRGCSSTGLGPFQCAIFRLNSVYSFQPG